MNATITVDRALVTVVVEGFAPIHLHASQLRRGEFLLSRADEWCEVSELARRGVLRKEFYQFCYGHTDYYAGPELLAEIRKAIGLTAPKAVRS